jgi:hypothetical protein
MNLIYQFEGLTRKLKSPHTLIELKQKVNSSNFIFLVISIM